MAYRHTFVVRGSFPFPIDMLRYDRCTPKSEADSNVITRSLEHQGTSEVFEVTVISDKELKGWEPTVGRWKSFGWELVPSTAARAEKLR